MQLHFLSSLCSILITGSILTICYAVPLSRDSMSSMLLDTLNQASRDKRSADEHKFLHSTAAVNNRQRRANDPHHNYVTTVFTLRETEWKPSCYSRYNCARVSPLHCSNAAAKLFCAQGEAIEPVIGSGCELNFEAYVDKGGITKGVDFSLYKKNESETEGVVYYAYFIYKTVEQVYISIASRGIPASCNGWQMFHTSNRFVNSIHRGLNNFTVLLAMFKQTPSSPVPQQAITCSEIKQAFFMDSKTQGFEFSSKNVEKRGAETNEVPTMSSAVSMTEKDQDTEITPTQTDLSTTAENKKDTIEEPNNTEKPKVEPTEVTATQTNEQISTEHVKEDSTETQEMTPIHTRSTSVTEIPTKESATGTPTSTKNAETTKDILNNSSLPTETTKATKTEAVTTQASTTTSQPVETTTVKPTEVILDPEDFIPVATFFVEGEALPI